MDFFVQIVTDSIKNVNTISTTHSKKINVGRYRFHNQLLYD